MRTELTVGAARPDDLAAVLGTRVLLTGAARQAALVRAAVENGGCFVARVGARIAGFVTWDRGFFDRAFVRLLVVEPAERRSGIGSALVGAVESAARPYGDLFVSTEAINVPMQRLLGTLGYVASGSIDNVNEPGNAELVYYKRFA